MIIANARSRRWKNRIALSVMTAMILVSLLPLASLMWTLLSKGVGAASNWHFLVNLPLDVPPGVGNAILGSVLILFVAALAAVPLGLLVGLYLAHFAQTRMASVTRTLLEVMAGIPAIVVGMFIYTVVVRQYGFSMLAGGLSLAMIMLPIFARTTEEAVKAIPATVNEAGLALGLTRRRVILRIILRSAMPAVLTGFFLALARVGGEAAPLLFTAFGSNGWPAHSAKAIVTLRPLTEQVASLPQIIYEYAKDPRPEIVSLAWGASLLLVGLILVIRISTNVFLHCRYGREGAGH